MKSVALLLLVFGLIASSNANASDVLTWEDCVQEASQNNPDLKAAAASVLKSRYDVKASVSDYFPQLSLDSSYTVNNSTVPGISFNRREDFETGGSVRQNVFSGLKTLAGYRKSKALLTDSDAALIATVAQISFDLKSAFASLLFAQERTSLTQTILDRRRENARLVNLRYEGGSENKGSTLRSQALQRQAEYDLQEARRQMETSQTDLARFLGRADGPSQEIHVRGSFGTVASRDASRADARNGRQPERSPNLGALALETPDYARAAAQLRASEADVSLARGDLFPSLDATASASRLHIVDGSDSNRWSAGMTLSYPFLLGGRDIFEVKGAKADRKKAEENLKSVEYRVTSDLKLAHAGFFNAVERVSVQESFLQAARVRAQITRSEYSNGLATFFDWDLIENDLILNEQNMLQTRRDALIAEAQWEKVQGKGAW